MDWNDKININSDLENVKNLEQKKSIGKKIAEFVKDGDVIGFGSGSTAFVAICEIAEKIRVENIHITAIPTSYEIEMLCNHFDIPIATIRDKRPDWSFDGADEIDTKNWVIKGRGGAMFREKLNIASSFKTYILVDDSKRVEHIGSRYSIPIECYSLSINYICEELLKMGANDIQIRKAVSKDGPVITELGNIILDVKFANITEDLERKIKNISGVIDSGLFIGYNIEIIS